MGSFTTLTAADGFACPAYVAQPAGAPKGAIVVVQEIFGVNAHIRAWPMVMPPPVTWPWRPPPLPASARATCNWATPRPT